MRGVKGILFKMIVLAAVVLGGGWLVWKSLPPYSPGTHDAVPVAEAAAAPAGGTRTSGPKIGNCEVLPYDNVWNTPIDKLPLDKNSSAYISSIGGSVPLHPDFASSMLSGIPFSDLPANTPHVKISFGYADESDQGNYPIPPNVTIEGGGTDPNADRHIILIDQRRCLLYEIFGADRKADGTWEAGSGEKYDMTSNSRRAEGRGSADAAGLQILPGLTRYDEVAAGEINHALRFTLPHTQAAFVWPATHLASHIKDTNVAPMGARLRLKASYDISGFSKSDQVILTALKKYGMILADNGGAMFISGAPDKRWDDADLHHLTRVTASDFEVVDESDYAMLADSMRVDPTAVQR